MSEARRLAIASALAGLAVVVAVGPPRPQPRPRPRLTVVPDGLEPFDASDVLEAHGIEVA